MDTRTGELLALADHPTFDASDPLDAPKEDLGSRAMSDVYEPGSVEKVLTVSGLIDAGKVTPRTKLRVPPELYRDGRVIKDWFPHDTIKLTLAGVLAKSSNIGTVLAADKFSPASCAATSPVRPRQPAPTSASAARRAGILPAAQRSGTGRPRTGWPSASRCRSTPCRWPRRSTPSPTAASGSTRRIITGSATTDDGVTVGTDNATTRQVVSAQAAEQTMRDDGAGRRPRGRHRPRRRRPGLPGRRQDRHRAAGRARSAAATTAPSRSRSPGFAPADDPRFTIYVVVQNPRNGGGGGSVGGPAFSKIMSYALRRYAVPPTGTKPSDLPVEWWRRSRPRAASGGVERRPGRPASAGWPRPFSCHAQR